MLRGKHQSGIALISVLFIAVVLMILASIFSSVITSENQSMASNKLVDIGVQVADGISERARMVIIDEYRNSALTNEAFLKKLYEGNYSGMAIDQVFSTSLDGYNAKWKISAVSQPDSDHLWVEIATTATTPKGAQTVIKRIGFGTSNIFQLAMLADNTDCMYCHLKVNGDVGSLKQLAPGWSGANSGKTSTINGKAYVAPTGVTGVTGYRTDGNTSVNASSASKINDADFTGGVETDYSGDKLPKDEDGDGIPDFPALTREMMAGNSYGTLTGGEKIIGIPSGSTLSSLPASSNLTTIKGKYDGNLILEGTATNPINLDEDIYASGDIIIKGYVTGRGALYAGRNIYIAGDLINVNPADKPGQGVCSSTTDADACARKNIAAGKDETRLGARGSIILGDYTETTTGGNPNLWRDMQAPDFFRSQFGFQTGTPKYYDKRNGDELFEIGGVFKNVDGTVVSAGNIAKGSSGVDGQTAYDYSFKPGTVTNSGDFQAWLGDDLYQDFLGDEVRGYNLWRYDVNSSSYASSTELLTELQTQFAGSTASDASLLEIADALKAGNTTTIDLKDINGVSVGEVNVRPNHIDVITDTKQTVTKQTKKVDAFLYANQRIAGKAFNAPMVINGGMIAKTLGVLAPGVMDFAMYGGFKPSASRYQALDNIDCSSSSSADLIGAPAHEPDAVDCSLTINYDNRMKTGGYSYNLIAAKLGQTLSWSLADKRTDRVE
ncbi:MAG: hypothetical protein KC422_07880 [Trueperaceae bacterium]|nr:hypothetical protein [Trueperaceae bacterium]